MGPIDAGGLGAMAGFATAGGPWNQPSVVSVGCVGWAGYCVDSGRQVPTSQVAKCGGSCGPPMI